MIVRARRPPSFGRAMITGHRPEGGTAPLPRTTGGVGPVGQAAYRQSPGALLVER
ncbi:hypothetical protein [Nonomuraea sp. NPDC003804]|uniref:hypothetical protein n=1 Tax=Nonomuraea sp. NPDC003804 TaxID=3154547 RepID=UPI0033B9E486